MGCPNNTPGCKYGDKPHFVPPGLGDVGFFMCAPPSDIRNHTRCVPPYDHEHSDHRELPRASAH